MNLIPLRLALQQRVLANYRAPFFDELATACLKGLSVFSGQPRPEEAIDVASGLKIANYVQGRNRHALQGRFYTCWQDGLTKWLNAWQPDALVVEANPRYLRTPEAVRWMHRRNLPVIGWGLGAPIHAGPLGELRDLPRKRFLAQFDALITYSRQGAEEYAENDFNPQRIFIAPNAVAPRPSYPMPERPLAFKDGHPTLLFVGRLQERKRVDLLIEACASLAAEFQPQLWIVGDGPEREDLESLARRTCPQTRFFGIRRGADLEPLYREADLFVLPGTGGLAIQQAMAYALPVMAAEADGTQNDLVRPGSNGWLLEPGNLDDLVVNLRNALADIARLRSFGRESFRITLEEINLQTMVKGFAEAINFAAGTI